MERGSVKAQKAKRAAKTKAKSTGKPAAKGQAKRAAKGQAKPAAKGQAKPAAKGRAKTAAKGAPAEEVVSAAAFAPDPMNANRGTDRGRAMLLKSLEDHGAGRSILADAKQRVLAGNKTLAQAAALDLPIRRVYTDGRELVAVIRTDLDLDNDGEGKARALALADNRVAEVDLDWDTEQLLALQGDVVALEDLWDEIELARLLQSGSSSGSPKGPPPSDGSTATVFTCPKCAYQWTG